MEHLTLGRSGLQVSRLSLGCMTYGTPGKGNQAWSLGEEESRPLIRRSLELGINFFDTANMYSAGASEEIVGRALRDFTPRDEVVIATKGYFAWKNRPNTGGLSRKALFAAIDDSLRRLGTDYVDLYQIHRWDNATPIEETMEALHDIVKSGKALHLGASSMYAWQFAKAQFTAELGGWTKFVSMQPHYNLVYREEEREMIPLCRDLGVGVIPWSPMARGRLTRPWRDATTTVRSTGDRVLARLYGATEEADRVVIDRVEAVAKQRGVPMSQVALAWVLHQPGITAPIIGASKAHHLDDAVAALTLKLTPEELASLAEAYVPHAIAGHGGSFGGETKYDAPTLLS